MSCCLCLLFWGVQCRTAVITCSRSIDRLNGNGPFNYIVFLSSDWDGADGHEYGWSRENRESKEEGQGLAVSSMPQQLTEEMDRYKVPCRGPHYEISFGVRGGSFLLQVVLVSMPEAGTVGGPCDQVQETHRTSSSRTSLGPQLVPNQEFAATRHGTSRLLPIDRSRKSEAFLGNQAG